MLRGSNEEAVMARQMVAQFQSRCGKCGQTIAPGTSINYERGAAAWHVVCPVAAAAPASPPAAAAPAPYAWSVDTGRTRPSDRVGTTLRCPGRAGAANVGKVVTIVRQSSVYIREDGDSLGLEPGHDSGWLLTVFACDATAEEAATFEAAEGASKAAEAARLQKIADERAAVKAAVDAGKARLAELTAGMVATETWSDAVLLPTDDRLRDPDQAVHGAVEGGGETVAAWSEGDRHRVSVQARTALTGERVYVVSSHDYDDDRSTLYAPQAIVEATWAARLACYPMSVEEAADWLAKYGPKDGLPGGCVGSDYRAWFLAQAKAEKAA